MRKYVDATAHTQVMTTNLVCLGRGHLFQAFVYKCPYCKQTKYVGIATCVHCKLEYPRAKFTKRYSIKYCQCKYRGDTTELRCIPFEFEGDAWGILHSEG